MDRTSVEKIMLRSAYLWAERSTCSRLAVGCVIARDGRIISTGYNGAPSGHPHCPVPHPEGPCTVSAHAEENALIFAAKSGISTDGADLYATHLPCRTCSRLIINAGIKRVFYRETYRSTEGQDLMLRTGIEVYKQIS